MTPEARPDAALLDEWQAGSQAAGRVLFDRHFDAVARFFSTKVPEDADDLVQTTFLACTEHSARFEGRSSFRGYLLGVANKVLLKHLRTRYGRGRPIDIDEVTARDLGTPLSARVARGAEHARLIDAFRELPLVQQVVLELYYWEELPASELSTILGVPEGTIRTRLRSAKQKLHALLGA